VDELVQQMNREKTQHMAAGRKRKTTKEPTT
jgi:hypothetical protein